MQALESHGRPGNVRELRDAVDRALALAGPDPLTRAHLRLETSGTSYPLTSPAVPCVREVPRMRRLGRGLSALALPGLWVLSITHKFQAVQVLTHSLRDRRPERGPAQDTREAIALILDHLDRHGDALWGHVITLPTEAGGGIRLVDRTDNSEEGFFHTVKHGLRRQSGRKILTQDFENLPAAAALAYNLERPDYVQILCASLEQLPDAIAALDQQGHTRRLAATTTDHVAEASAEIEMLSSSLPRVDRPVIRAMGLGQRIAAAAKSRAPHYAVA